MGKVRKVRIAEGFFLAKNRFVMFNINLTGPITRGTPNTDAV